jgi:hypothetical protein
MEAVQFRVPGVSKIDRNYIIQGMETKLLFPKIRDPGTRRLLEKSLLSIKYLIPSIRSLHENSKLIGVGSKLLKQLVLGSNARQTLHTTLRDSWLKTQNVLVELEAGRFRVLPNSSKWCWKVAYKQLWLLMLRNFADLGGRSPRKETGRPLYPSRLTPKVEHTVAKTVWNLGFHTEAIRLAALSNPEKQTLQSSLGQVFRLEGIELEKAVDKLLRQLPRETGMEFKGTIENETLTCEIKDVERRCGIPYERAYNTGKLGLYLTNIIEKPSVVSEDMPSAMFIWQDFMRSFFGKTPDFQDDLEDIPPEENTNDEDVEMESVTNISASPLSEISGPQSLPSDQSMSPGQDRMGGLSPSVLYGTASPEIRPTMTLAQNLFPGATETGLVSLREEVVASRLSLSTIPEPERSPVFDLTIPEIFEEFNTGENQTRNSDLVMFTDNSTIEPAVQDLQLFKPRNRKVKGSALGIDLAAHSKISKGLKVRPRKLRIDENTSSIFQSILAGSSGLGDAGAIMNRGQFTIRSSTGFAQQLSVDQYSLPPDQRRSLDTWLNIEAPSSSQRDPPLQLEYNIIPIGLKEPPLLIENGFVEVESGDDEVGYPNSDRSNGITGYSTSALMMPELPIDVLREPGRSPVPSLSSQASTIRYTQPLESELQVIIPPQPQQPAFQSGPREESWATLPEASRSVTSLQSRLGSARSTVAQLPSPASVLPPSNVFTPTSPPGEHLQVSDHPASTWSSTSSFPDGTTVQGAGQDVLPMNRPPSELSQEFDELRSTLVNVPQMDDQQPVPEVAIQTTFNPPDQSQTSGIPDDSILGNTATFLPRSKTSGAIRSLPRSKTSRAGNTTTWLPRSKNYGVTFTFWLFNGITGDKKTLKSQDMENYLGLRPDYKMFVEKGNTLVTIRREKVVEYMMLDPSLRYSLVIKTRSLWWQKEGIKQLNKLEENGKIPLLGRKQISDRKENMTMPTDQHPLPATDIVSPTAAIDAIGNRGGLFDPEWSLFDCEREQEFERRGLSVSQRCVLIFDTTLVRSLEVVSIPLKDLVFTRYTCRLSSQHGLTTISPDKIVACSESFPVWLIQKEHILTFEKLWNAEIRQPNGSRPRPIQMNIGMAPAETGTSHVEPQTDRSHVDDFLFEDEDSDHSTPKQHADNMATFSDTVHIQELTHAQPNDAMNNEENAQAGEEAVPGQTLVPSSTIESKPIREESPAPPPQELNQQSPQAPASKGRPASPSSARGVPADGEIGQTGLVAERATIEPDEDISTGLRQATTPNQTESEEIEPLVMEGRYLGRGLKRSHPVKQHTTEIREQNDERPQQKRPKVSPPEKRMKGKQQNMGKKISGLVAKFGGTK